MRILTWNTQGSRDSAKAEEMEALIDYWVENKDAIVIICLQEVAAADDTIQPLLEAKRFECISFKEGWNDTGRAQMIAIAQDSGISVLGSGRVNSMNLTADEKGQNVRIPMYCEIGLEGKRGIVYNYHAESPSSLARRSMLRKVGGHVSQQSGGYDFTAAAGDFNTNDVSEIRSVFSEFDAMHHRYDYFITKGVTLSDGRHSEWTTSDHRPVSASMAI